jgi:tetratricopeptide (TPR) repeat protein
LALPTAPAEANVVGQPPARDVAPANRALEAPTATSADLLNLATTGNWQSFQAAALVLMDQPKPATGDRKLARSLNDQAITLAVTDIQKSLALLRQAHATDPADAEIADNLGMALRIALNYDQSEVQLMKVITTWPNRQTAWANLGQTLSVQNKRREAVGAYVASYKVSKNPRKVLEVYKRIVDDPLDKEDPQTRKDLNAALEIIKSTSN